MKRFIAVLSGLLFLPAFAEVAPVYYDEIVEYTDELIDEAEEQPVEEEVTKPVATKKPVVVQRNVAGRSVSRAISTGTSTNSRVNTNTRAVASSPRNATQTPRGTVSRTAKTQTVSARPQVATRATVTSRATAGSTRTSSASKPVTARVAATGSVISGARTNSGTPNMLTDSGEPLYISGGTAARVGTGRRTPSRNASAATGMPVINDDDVSTLDAFEEKMSTLDALAKSTDYCKAQYAQCMDNYCNVLDDNQGRCSCSNNIKKYEKTELALEEASENFQEVVQKIRYIGLTASQIDALFTETEAELKMRSASDTSTLKNSLENIKKKIVDVSGTKSSTSLLDGVSFDMSGILNSDFLSGFDLNSFLNTSTNVSNQRGASLYNTATQRCRTSVLNSCVEQGVDSKVITNSYDLAIDKQCIEYERSLNEANAEMRSNVRNAQNILQQARLMLVQQKNAYDLRGCVAALDECMQDEYVCGDDYELCLDPTGKYLANGEIVKGGMPGIAGGTSVNQTDLSGDVSTALGSVASNGMYGLYSTWNYGDNCGTTGNVECNNAWGKGNEEDLNGYIDAYVSKWKGKTTSTSDIATYLLGRVGYVDDKDENQTYGMCANVLKQCQNYTFDNNKKYKFDNEVVRQYLALALTKIKLKQDEILADYAETCWNDVYSCLSTNNYDETRTDSIASKTAVNACRSEVSTCMSVTGFYPTNNQTITLETMVNWVGGNIDPDWTAQTSPDQCGYALVRTARNSNAKAYLFFDELSNDFSGAISLPAAVDGQNYTYAAVKLSAGDNGGCQCPEGTITLENTSYTLETQNATDTAADTFLDLPAHDKFYNIYLQNHNKGININTRCKLKQ